MEPCLPQHDPRPGRRYRQLAAALDTYRYDHEGPIALLSHLPTEDRFGLSYLAKRFFTGGRFALNIAAVKLRLAIRPHTALEDYRRYYPLIRNKPAVMDRFDRDEIFGWQRYAGANPMDVRCLAEAPPDFPIDDALLSAAVGRPTTLAAEIDARRAFVADYSYLWPVCDAVDRRQGERFLCAPKVLLWQPPAVPARQGEPLLSPAHRGEPRGHRPLKPVAIQLRPTPAPDNPVFTPADGADWFAAKIFAQCGDTTSHEMKHHLAQTHLVLEPVAIAMKRQLAKHHPVAILLEQHLDALLAINDFGRRTLINPGGFLDQLMAGWLPETMGIVGDAVADWSWETGKFQADLALRNLDETNPDYDLPYRDDGKLVWRAIHHFVGAYVRLYYRSADDVRHDLELQRWIEELTREGRARGLPAQLDTVDEVVALLTQIVWMSGPKHACVNYAQWDYVGFVPNMPFAMYGRAPSGKGTFTAQAEVAKVLPPADDTLKQILLMEALTGWQHGRLGHYRRGAFADPRVAPLVERFQRELAEVEDTIGGRNTRREVAYPYLLPSRIPNSTNT